MSVENELKHYGVLGMKWGIRRLEKRISKAKASGKTEKAERLKSRLSDERKIQSLPLSEKIFLSREGVKANMRLMAKGQSKTERLLKLHGLELAYTAVTTGASQAVGKAIKNRLAGVTDPNELIKLAAINVGAQVAVGAGSKIARDEVYKRMG